MSTIRVCALLGFRSTQDIYIYTIVVLTFKNTRLRSLHLRPVLVVCPRIVNGLYTKSGSMCIHNGRLDGVDTWTSPRREIAQKTLVKWDTRWRGVNTVITLVSSECIAFKAFLARVCKFRALKTHRPYILWLWRWRTDSQAYYSLLPILERGIDGL